MKMTKQDAINQLIKDGMEIEEAKSEFNERCEYYMRGNDGTTREYAEELVITDIEEISE